MDGSLERIQQTDGALEQRSIRMLIRNRHPSESLSLGRCSRQQTGWPNDRKDCETVSVFYIRKGVYIGLNHTFVPEERKKFKSKNIFIQLPAGLKGFRGI